MEMRIAAIVFSWILQEFLFPPLVHYFHITYLAVILSIVSVSQYRVHLTGLPHSWDQRASSSCQLYQVLPTFLGRKDLSLWESKTCSGMGLCLSF